MFYGRCQDKEMMAVEDRVIARTNTKFTHTGEYLGIPATRKTGEVSAIVLYRIKDGKVVEIREEFNRLSIMQQLGMELKPKEGEQ
jgi:predicted ester cyclase